MEQKEADLYQRTTDVFLKNGIRESTMDDMAKELKVSKKTLYKYVSNRPELVTKSMKWKMAENEKALSAILSKNLNAIEELCEITNFYCGNLKDVHPSIHIDLNKYYKDAWNEYVNYRNNFLYNVILSNI
ncbi:MAG: TetR/AcrR family transcriptional regulator [Bacteroidetes bacterium]|nr:TetR/AcrR family transcriptional regulator [Bacteroidota bacterium]